MIILGLTGSVAMGKSVAGRLFRRRGVPLFDSDAEVHALMAPGGAAVAAVGARFPGALVDQAIDRGRLGRIVYGDEKAMKELEDILHPLVRAAQRDFLQEAAASGAKIVVLDIPLLFESGSEAGCDAIAVVSAPAFLQHRRALRRPEMTARRLARIVARQTADSEKRRRADFIIPSGFGKAVAAAHIGRILKRLAAGTENIGPAKTRVTRKTP